MNNEIDARKNALSDFINWQDILVLAGYFSEPDYSIAHELSEKYWWMYGCSVLVIRKIDGSTKGV